MQEIKTIEQYNKVINSNEVVVIDIWATWCGPCRQLKAQLEETNPDFVWALDADDLPNIPNELKVRSVPCLIAFRNGKELDRKVGSSNVVEINNWVQQLKLS